MANRLAMATVQAILQLHSLRWSQRRIAEELEIDRKTVRRHLLRHLGGPNAPKAPTGSEHSKGATLRPVPARDDETSGRADPAGQAVSPHAARAPTGSLDPIDDQRRASLAPSRSACEPHRALILAKLEQGLSSQRIHQDLAAEQGFTARYWSVRRFVERLTGRTPLPMRRLESEPGGEAQIDFGTGVPITLPDQPAVGVRKRRKTHVFRVVLSHSRKAYSEVCYRQTTEDFLRAIENAFWHFGGVPKTLVIDNLKAAVTHPDWFDPELNPKLLSFCQHYGTVILPTKPRTPRHKGKIERGIGYVKGNALKGHTFTSLEAQNRHLEVWERSVADTRIHGTTKQQVGKVFAEVERAALGPLPRDRFPSFQEARRIVSRDGHIEVAKSYYSTPPEYLGRSVWARWDARLVRIFNSRLEQIAVHVRQEPGRFSTLGEHLVAEKISGIERGAVWLLSKARSIGPHTHEWAESMLKTRGIEGLRALQGLLSLANRHTGSEMDQACQTALSYGAFRLRTLRQLLKRRGPTQEPLPFLDEHPIIRPMADYGSWVRSALASPGGRNQQDPQVPSPGPPTSFPSSLFP
jgi:transposase